MNFLRPAKARRLSCHGRTRRAGKNIVFSESEVFALDSGEPQLVATCTSTLAVIPQGARPETSATR